MRAGNGFGGGPRAVAAQLARAVEIATILSASGFDWLVQALGLSTWVSPRRLVCALRPGAKYSPALAADVPLPERLRLTLERLGPTFVKAGQMLALRPNYVPLEYAEALRGLHTHVAPFPSAEAVAIVEAELGAPLGALYAEFDREPFAAASLAQVHRARLFDGRPGGGEGAAPRHQDAGRTGSCAAGHTGPPLRAAPAGLGCLPALGGGG